jgi:uncharacterized protein YjiS (DUF1127 family)
MSTQRQYGPRGSVPADELNARLLAFGLGRARLLRAVAVRRAGQTMLRAVATALQHSGKTLWTWQNRYDARRHMAQLDARLLADVGLRREDVMQAARRPFWKA